MASKRVALSNLLRMSRAWQGLVRLAPGEIDDALVYVQSLEEAGDMGRREAAEWRWRILACWAEHHRRARAT